MACVSYPQGCCFSSLADIAGKKIVVMGIGLHGGGEESVRFYIKHGASVIATDTKTEEQLRPVISKLKNEFESELKTGRLRFSLSTAPGANDGHKIKEFEEADVVIKNPGVKFTGSNNRFLMAAKAVETDMSVFLALCKIPVIAVTGSKGKSTSAEAIYYGLEQAGYHPFLSGNIPGRSPYKYFDTDSGANVADIVVLELSSWQLADLRGRGVLKPKAALITPVYPDHMNWYENSMEDYAADKKIIYKEQDESGWTICELGGAHPRWGDEFAAETKARILRYSSTPLPNGILGAWLEPFTERSYPLGKIRLSPCNAEGDIIVDELEVPGMAARRNVLNAALVLAALGVEAEKIRRIYAGWKGIKHRLEFFYRWQGAKAALRFYNDSAATIPEAAANALTAFDKPLWFICGGTDKEISAENLLPLLDALAAYKHKYKRPVFLIDGGAHNNFTRSKLLPALIQNGIDYEGPFANFDALLAALKMTIESTKFEAGTREEAVVFSPGAASFGLFDNEFVRGDIFKETVSRIFG